MREGRRLIGSGVDPPEGPLLREGWYLMSVRDLEIELARHRDPSRAHETSTAQPLTTDEALAYRAAGNLPDGKGRSLRLVLAVDGEPLEKKRLRYEPDFHSAPSWRKEGSKPINVVPLKTGPPRGVETESAWWEQADMAPLEDEWERTGTVGGVAIPAELRGFVFKTIVALHAAGVEVTKRSILDSVSRWLSPGQVQELRVAFEDLEPR